MIKITTLKQIECPINDSVTIKFQTDAEDSYFNEHTGIGKIEFEPDIIERQSLKTGIFALKLKPSISFPNLKINQIVFCRFSIKEKSIDRFNFTIPIKIIPETKKELPTAITKQTPHKKSLPYTRKPVQNNESDGEGRWNPPIIKVMSDKHEKWNEMFKGNKMRGAYVDLKADNSMEIWVNTSHPSLIHYQENHPDKPPKKLIDKYSHYIGFMTYASFCIKEGEIIDYETERDLKDMMEDTSDAIAFFGMLYNDAT